MRALSLLHSHLPNLLAAGVAITPNTSIPGTANLELLVGGLMTVCLACAIAALVFGGAVWGFAERRGNFTVSHAGRRLCEGGLLGGLVIGAAVALVNAAFGIGLGF